MIEDIKACAFTGHRDISIRNTLIASDIVDNVLKLHFQGCRDFYVGGALGFDMLATMMLVSLKKKNIDLNIHFILPCEDYSKRWSSQKRKQQEYLLTYATEVTVLSEKYYAGCMQNRNRELVDNSDCLIAYLKKESGGTYYTCNYAKKCGKKVIYL